MAAIPREPCRPPDPMSRYDARMDDANVTDNGADPDLPPEDTPEQTAGQVGLRLVGDDADGFQLADDGTVNIRYTQIDGERWEAVCRHPTIAAYSEIVDALDVARDRIAEMREENEDMKARILAVGTDAEAGETEDADANRELRALRREWDRKDNRDKVEIRQLALGVLGRTVELTSGAIVPADAPVWLSMWGAVDVMMRHWEATPFRGPVGNRKQRPAPAGAPKRS